MVKTTAETSNDYRSRQKAKGLKKLELWIYPENEQFIRNHAELLQTKTEKDKGEDNEKK
jgi:hypothetical protein